MKRPTLLKNGLLLGALLAPLSAHATTITIVNADGPGEGFNDPTPVAPVGGNTGTTLGEQRLIVFQYAASHWASRFDSAVEIKVEANLDPLSCNSSSAVVGSAGTTTVHRNFSGAPLSATWYPQALANALAGTDLSPTNPDIGTTFNSAIDNNNSCLSGTNWYLGLDGNPGGDIDMVDVVMHEIGHGLGFASYVNESTGAPFMNYMDVYSVYLEDHSTGRTWPEMTNNQRATSATDNGDLHFVGSNLVARAGHTRMYAPSTVRPGSSVSHFDTSLSPNELMEPYVAPTPIHDMGLAYELMLDLGWQSAGQPGNTAPDVTISSPTTGAEYTEGATVSLTASSTDAEDGSLTESISWNSDRDGTIGTGGSTTTDTLSVGDHLISASATDTNGVSGSDEVSISIVAAATGTAPAAPSTVVASDAGSGNALITWQDNSADESSFTIVRESPHKKRPNTWVGTTQVASVPADTEAYTDPSGAGTYRYCVAAVNAAGSSSAVCSAAEEITGSGGSDGGSGGGGSFCDSHPNHKRCS